MITVESAMKDRNTKRAVETDENESDAKKKALTKKVLIAVGVTAGVYLGYTLLMKKGKNGEVQSSM